LRLRLQHLQVAVAGGPRDVVEQRLMPRKVRVRGQVLGQCAAQLACEA
jgi:hypothetical protein